MFHEEIFPNEFQKTILHMIFKGKGRREILSDNRFIHSYSWFSRTVEGLVISDGLKGPLVSGSSIYQVEGQAGHRPEELIFSPKSIIANHRKPGKMVIIQSYDVSKFFDKEMNEQGVLTCLKKLTDPKAVRLWYKLNENTKIQVKTCASLSEEAEVGAVIGQGTISGSLVSQAVLDDAVMEHFPPAGNLQLEYGTVSLSVSLHYSGPFTYDLFLHIWGRFPPKDSSRSQHSLCIYRAIGF